MTTLTSSTGFGQKTKSFTFTLDTLQWYAENSNAIGTDMGEAANSVTFPSVPESYFTHYPASASQRWSGWSFQMASSLWAMPFFDDGVIEVVFTGVSYKMKGTAGEQ